MKYIPGRHFQLPLHRSNDWGNCWKADRYCFIFTTWTVRQLNKCNFAGIELKVHSVDQTYCQIPFAITVKANRLHPRNYPQTPTDYRHTDNDLRLVMVVIALCCTWQSRAPNIDRCVPYIWPWPRSLTLTPTFDLDLKASNSDVDTQFLAFYLDFWPTT